MRSHDTGGTGECEVSMTNEVRLNIFADYSQFYLEDGHYVHSELPRLWNEQSSADMIAAAPGVVAVGTARNFDVPVTVWILGSEPEEDPDRWDHVAEAPLALPSGELLIFGPTDWPDAERLAVEPGHYRARVQCANLESVAPNGIDGEDFYEVVLWPGAEEPPRVLKRSEWSMKRQ
jgi:hypothetical protein